MVSSPITSWQIDGKTMETVRNLFRGAPKSLQMVTAAMKLKDVCSLEESYDKPRQYIKKQRHKFADKKSVQSKLWFFQWSCVDVRVGP